MYRDFGLFHQPWCWRVLALITAVVLLDVIAAPGLRADPGAIAIAQQKIKHVIIIMQENRSFDHYFGTYPGADGLPRSGSKFTVCVPDPQTKTCVFPYHDKSFKNGGGGHNGTDAMIDIDGGKMDGFIADVEKLFPGHCGDPTIKGCSIDVMGTTTTPRSRTTGSTPARLCCMTTCSSRSRPIP